MGCGFGCGEMMVMMMDVCGGGWGIWIVWVCDWVGFGK